MRGRKPKPTNIHVLEGGKQKTHRNLNDKEPKPDAKIPKCPKHLDKEARAEWKRMARELEPLGLLSNLDKAVFASYCQAFSTWAQATKKVHEQGLVFKAPNGMPMMNPYLPIVNKANEQMLKALIELGMSPSSRSRIKVEAPAKPQENKKERFFK
jgi:P27 family predicted phage terminase small subunit